MTVGTVGWFLVLAAVLAVAALGHCQAYADHTGFTDPCTTSLGVIAVGLLLAISLGPLGYSLPALAGTYCLHPPDLTSPPPEA